MPDLMPVILFDVAWFTKKKVFTLMTPILVPTICPFGVLFLWCNFILVAHETVVIS
jgi:hypothetical protein